MDREKMEIFLYSCVTTASSKNNQGLTRSSDTGVSPLALTVVILSHCWQPPDASLSWSAMSAPLVLQWVTSSLKSL